MTSFGCKRKKNKRFSNQKWYFWIMTTWAIINFESKAFVDLVQIFVWKCQSVFCVFVWHEFHTNLAEISSKKLFNCCWIGHHCQVWDIIFSNVSLSWFLILKQMTVITTLTFGYSKLLPRCVIFQYHSKPVTQFK